MSLFTKKRNADKVAIVSVALVSVILSLFSSWLFYSSNIEKAEKTNNIRIQMYKHQINDLQNKNKILEEKLSKINEALNPEEKPLEEVTE